MSVGVDLQSYFKRVMDIPNIIETGKSSLLKFLQWYKGMKIFFSTLKCIPGKVIAIFVTTAWQCFDILF